MGQIVVDGGQVGTFANHRVEDQRQSRCECFSFTGLHLGNATMEKAYTSENLDIVMPHVQAATPSLADQGVAFRQERFEWFTAFGAVDQGQKLFAQLRVRECFAVFYPAVNRTGLLKPLVDFVGPDAWDLPAGCDVRAVRELQRDVFARVGNWFVVHSWFVVHRRFGL